MENLVYHGTRSLNDAIHILESGELLSPWYQSLRLYQSLSEEKIKRLLDSSKFSNIEDFALESAAVCYQKRELESRVKSISVTPNFDKAKSYAREFGGFGGVVFGLDEKVVFGLENNNDVIFVPKLISLGDSLEKVYFSGSKDEKISIENYSLSYGLYVDQL
jgi:hypothetical protein